MAIPRALMGDLGKFVSNEKGITQKKFSRKSLGSLQSMSTEFPRRSSQVTLNKALSKKSTAATDKKKLSQAEPMNDTAFIYEDSSDKKPGELNPDDFNIVMASTEHAKEKIESLRPTNRKEVALLKQTMVSLIHQLGSDDDQDYPTDMHAFLSVIQEEQKIYDVIFQELIRQVTVNMIERGELLSEIRRRYSNMFVKIPRHVKHLHVELVAQRKLNKRLTEELVQSKEFITELRKEVDSVRKHDADITNQAKETQEKLVSVLTQSDNSDEVLEEYHKLYKMQRDRLEESVALIEKEKRMWIEAAMGLTVRISEDQGIPELILLQKFEQARLRASNHLILLICNSNDAEIGDIEKKIDETRKKVMALSQSVVTEDYQNIEILAKLERNMKIILNNLDGEGPIDAIEAEHPLLRSFHVYDVKTISENLMKWIQQISVVSVRFTSERDLGFRDEIAVVKSLIHVWVESGLKLMRKNEKTTNGKAYVALKQGLNDLNMEIEQWLRKIELRVFGEDGVATLVISLQNQLEDRYTKYSARDFSKPLTSSERLQIKESILGWIDQTVALISTLAVTTEKEQDRVPLHLENWVSRVLDQLTTDNDIRNGENMKLHTETISWLVQLLVKGTTEKSNEAWDQEFHQLHQEMISFNLNLMRDSGDVEMLADDNSDLRKSTQEHTDNWISVAKVLLDVEKRNSHRLHDKKGKEKLLGDFSLSYPTG